MARSDSEGHSSDQSGAGNEGSKDHRVFYLLDKEGERIGRYRGWRPRRVALKAARRFPDEYVAESEDMAEQRLIRLEDEEKSREHLYWGWAWVEATDDGDLEHLGDEKTRARVSKEGVRSI